MNALRNVLDAVVTGGIVLDLQTVRPPPRVEAAERVVCELDATEFFERADANDLVMMGAVRDGLLALEAEDHPEVLQRWSTGAELVADWAPRRRRIPAAMITTVGAIEGECLVREPCRTRRLRKR